MALRTQRCQHTQISSYASISNEVSYRQKLQMKIKDSKDMVDHYTKCMTDNFSNPKDTRLVQLRSSLDGKVLLTCTNGQYYFETNLHLQRLQEAHKVWTELAALHDGEQGACGELGCSEDAEQKKAELRKRLFETQLHSTAMWCWNTAAQQRVQYTRYKDRDSEEVLQKWMESIEKTEAYAKKILSIVEWVD